MFIRRLIDYQILIGFLNQFEIFEPLRLRIGAILLKLLRVRLAVINLNPQQVFNLVGVFDWIHSLHLLISLKLLTEF